MHVLVIGGTGFIGHHIVRELQSQNIEISLLSRNPDKARRVFGDGIHYHQGDLNFFRDIHFKSLFKGVDALVYAAGTDERQAPVGDPYTFFYRENVTTCINMLEFARQAGIRRAIVLGSVFSWFNRQYPDMQLEKHHPYIRSRVEQLNQSLTLADDNFQVNVIEIPFVFGYTPGQGTIWNSLVQYIRVAAPMVAPRGGANVISVNSLAKAIVGALLRVEESGPLTVGDRNMTWVEIMTGISRIVNKQPKKITMLQSGVFADLTRMGAFFQELVGFKSGLDHNQVSQLITFEAFFDTQDIKQKLDYEGDDIEQAFVDTVKACPENLLINNLQRSIDWLSKSTQQTIRTFDKILFNKKQNRR